MDAEVNGRYLDLSDRMIGDRGLRANNFGARNLRDLYWRYFYCRDFRSGNRNGVLCRWCRLPDFSSWRAKIANGGLSRDAWNYSQRRNNNCDGSCKTLARFHWPRLYASQN
jgi:hypothetical protein